MASMACSSFRMMATGHRVTGVTDFRSRAAAVFAVCFCSADTGVYALSGQGSLVLGERAEDVEQQAALG